MSKTRAKGTAAETAVVNYCHRRGRPHVERRALSGKNDRGDIAGIPGVVIEVKDHKVSSLNFPGYVDEANTERDNDNAEIGVAWVKRRGSLDPAKWIVAMDGATLLDLLEKAGY